MSTRPSAFDALISGARAAAGAKKKSQPSSSPKKRKASDPEPASNSDSKPSQETHLQSFNGRNMVEENGSDGVGNAKEKFYADSTSSVDRVAKLKSNISNLKRKAGEFDPKLVAFWDDVEKVPFLFLSLTFDLIANETGRIVITDIVCNMLRAVMYTTPDDLVAVVYLSANRIARVWRLELGILRL